jgi:hypothetical protein
MATLARRPYLYRENGCPWRANKCKEITTMNEAELYARAHSIECIYNLVVVQDMQHKGEREEAETACLIAIEVAEVN